VLPELIRRRESCPPKSPQSLYCGIMDAQGKLTLFNAIATAGRTIYDIAQGTSKLEEKQQLMKVYDTLMSLKRSAGDLEDENHDLKAELRFKSDDFEFKNPFWFEKNHPDRPLCPKCFSKRNIGPVAASYDNGSGVFRRCLACDTIIEEGPSRRSMTEGPTYGGGSWQ
jgi:hypothetical protein